ncbi:MAG: phospholipase [Actinobacteria bacterium]|nr:phospholipase [Actinomycetota bacterium]
MSGESDWFLTPDQRGNPGSAIDRRNADGTAWTTGNLVTPLVHGAVYFERLVGCLRELKAGDRMWFTDWRGDEDQVLTADGTRLGDLLVELASRGVEVRALLWRSHTKAIGYHAEEHTELAERVNEVGGHVMLDERVRRAGSHHQKIVILRHPGRPGSDVAFVGGIDLCHGRRDDGHHRGDPQPEAMESAYGPTPAWHDVQSEVRGPAIGDLAMTFLERWNDQTPLERRTPWNRVRARLGRQPVRSEPLRAVDPDPPPAGAASVQVMRTYPEKTPPYPFAPQGERSIAREYHKAFARARRLVYVEDQYLWSGEVAELYVRALRDNPDLRVIVVVPRVPDRNGVVSGPAHRIGQLEVLRKVHEAGAGRMAVYDLENEAGSPIYVHAKVVVIDDVLAAVGSDNMNRRSWTHDSEVSLAVLDERDDREPTDPAGSGDGARRFARDLRLRLMREHLATESDEGIVNLDEAFSTFTRSAAALEAWHDAGCVGPRPTGRLRPHRPRDLHLWEVWGAPLYHLVLDPDGRPRKLRRAGGF